MKLTGSAAVHPTEDQDRVSSAILNIFPAARLVSTGTSVEFETSFADRFVEALREQQIRDTAMMVLKNAMEGGSTSFHLNKQAAFMGKVNFTEGRSTLGDIEVTVIEGAELLISAIDHRHD